MGEQLFLSREDQVDVSEFLLEDQEMTSRLLRFHCSLNKQKSTNLIDEKNGQNKKHLSQRFFLGVSLTSMVREILSFFLNPGFQDFTI